MKVCAARAGRQAASPAAKSKEAVTLLLQQQQEEKKFSIKRILILNKLTQLSKRSHLTDFADQQGVEGSESNHGQEVSDQSKVKNSIISLFK